MSRNREFGGALAATRKQSGFPTAYQFYVRNGGRRVFGFTYQYYLKIERGLSLPDAAKLLRILPQMRLQAGSPARRRLLLAYLGDLLGGRANYESLLAPYICAHAAAGRPELREIGKMLQRENSHNLSAEQFRAVASDEAVYWCFDLLFSDRGAWSGADAAELLGLDARRCAAALETLRGMGLARRTAAGRFVNPHAGKCYSLPSLGKEQERMFGKILRYWDAMARRKGANLCSRRILLRAEKSSIETFLPLILDPFNAVNGCSLFDKGENSAFFTLELRVRKLFDA